MIFLPKEQSTLSTWTIIFHLRINRKLSSGDENFLKINISFLFFSCKVDNRKSSLDECAQTWTNRGQSYPTRRIDEKYSPLDTDVKFFNSILPFLFFIEVDQRILSIFFLNKKLRSGTSTWQTRDLIYRKCSSLQKYT